MLYWLRQEQGLGYIGLDKRGGLTRRRPAFGASAAILHEVHTVTGVTKARHSLPSRSLRTLCC
eukprot:337467-Amorphochlora_amoeboformis.AAC.1